jgi:hypothetical protein
LKRAKKSKLLKIIDSQEFFYWGCILLKKQIWGEKEGICQ